MIVDGDLEYGRKSLQQAVEYKERLDGLKDTIADEADRRTLKKLSAEYFVLRTALVSIVEFPAGANLTCSSRGRKTVWMLQNTCTTNLIHHKRPWIRPPPKI